MDCFCLFCLNGAILNNSTTACYNYMIPELTSIHLQRFGLPEEAVNCSVLLNHNMCHHVKTKAGVSKEHYRHELGNEKYGEGQGKTSSPSNWTFQISTMLSALHKLVLGINMFSVCKQYVEKRVAESYVDDTDCTYLDQQDQENETLTSIRNRLHSIAQTWENLIFGSGGSLSHDKTYWWLIWWLWDGEHAKMAASVDVPTDLSIKFGNSQSPQRLKCKEPFDLIPQLGLKNNKAAKYSDAIKDKRGISKAITHCLKNLTISSRNTFRLYRNIWLPKMQYSLAATFFPVLPALTS
eukprot:8087923-Ditylum_brightwellii.AAC.2